MLIELDELFDSINNINLQPSLLEDYETEIQSECIGQFQELQCTEESTQIILD